MCVGVSGGLDAGIVVAGASGSCTESPVEASTGACWVASAEPPIGVPPELSAAMAVGLFAATFAGASVGRFLAAFAGAFVGALRVTTVASAVVFALCGAFSDGLSIGDSMDPWAGTSAKASFCPSCPSAPSCAAVPGTVEVSALLGD